MNRFGNYLYTLRRGKGMTQAELADLLGITNKAVSKWETGEAFPETAQLVPLADIFGVSVDDLLRGGSQTEEAPEKKEPLEEVRSEIWTEKIYSEEEIDRIAQKYRPESWNIKFALLIGLGILLAAAGIVALVLAGVLSGKESVHLFFAVILIACLTLAAGIFTAAGIIHERYFLPVEAENWKARVRRFILFMVAGIILGGAGICVFLCSGFYAEGGIFENKAVLAACIGGGLALFALAAFFFVYGGITWDAFCKKAFEKEYEKEQSEILKIIKELTIEKSSKKEKEL